MHGATRFFIVDDESINLELFGVILRHLNYTKVNKYFTAHEALKVHEYTPADIIFLDLYLAKDDENGIEEIEKFKALNDKTKVVIVSSEPTAENVTHALSRGADGFLAKPFNAISVENTLRFVLRKN